MVYLFLVPLMLGFVCNSASAFTAAYTRRWGDRVGRVVTFLLRNVLGIPVWVVGLALAMRMQVPLLLAPQMVGEVLGWLLVTAGCVAISLALLAIGSRAVAPSMQDGVVVHGVYAYVRHPMYAGMLLVFPGLFVLGPSVPVLVACMLGAGWVLVQARLEEVDLVQRIPGYREYMRRVPRFLPRPRGGRPT